MKLTQPIVNNLTLPPGKTDVIFFDDDVPGLGLRLRAGGKRSWVFQYGIGPKQRRMTLGTAPALSLAVARKTASELHARVRLGEDPAASKRAGQRRAADTFEAVLRIYLPERKQALTANSYRAIERYLLRYAKPLHGLGVALISRRDVGTLLATIGAAPSANRLRASLSAFYTWCMQRGLCDQNPVMGTYVAPETARSRALPVAELAAVWRACEDNAYGAIVRLLILTGSRREEIGALQPAEIRDDMIVLPGSRTKNKRRHDIPLSATAQAVLATWPERSRFTDWAAAKRRLDGRLVATGVKLEAWRLHDLRRSAATGMAEIGVQPHIIEAVLNHMSGHKAGIAGIYNRATYEREKRQALNLWAEHVVAAVENRADKVVPLRA